MLLKNKFIICYLISTFSFLSFYTSIGLSQAAPRTIQRNTTVTKTTEVVTPSKPPVQEYQLEFPENP